VIDRRRFIAGSGARLLAAPFAAAAQEYKREGSPDWLSILWHPNDKRRYARRH